VAKQDEGMYCALAAASKASSNTKAPLFFMMMYKKVNDIIYMNKSTWN